MQANVMRGLEQAVKLIGLIGLGVLTYFISVPASLSTWKTKSSTTSITFHWILFPLTILIGILYTDNLVKDVLLGVYVKLFFLLVIIIALLVTMILTSQFEVFKCYIVGCTVSSLPPPQTDEFADDYNNPASGQNSMALMAFFTALSILPVIAYQFVRLLLTNFNSIISNNDIGHHKNESSTNPIFQESEMVSSVLNSQATATDITKVLKSSSAIKDTITNASSIMAYDMMKQRKTRMRTLMLVFCLVLVFPVHVVLTARLGNCFQWMFPYNIALYGARHMGGEPANNAYYYAVNEYEWTNADPAKGQVSWASYIQNNAGYVPQIRVSNDVVLKFYPDVIIFYSYIYVVTTTALLAQFVPQLGRFFSFRPKIKYLQGVTIGEIVMTVFFALFLFTSLCYWYFCHGWENYYRPTQTRASIWGRTIGQLSLATMGLLILPVTRNSIWTTVFALSWEARIYFHRTLGIIFMTLSLAHTFVFWIDFANLGVFPSAILSSSPNTYLKKNFTIAPMTPLFMIVGCGVFLILTLDYFRRNHFEVFYYTHFFSMVLLLAIIWHAASGWYYLMPGLALWFMDHAIRFTKACEDIHIVSFKPVTHGGDTVIELAFLQANPMYDRRRGVGVAASSDKRPLPCEAGQIVFLSVPVVGGLEVHPFSISSSPLDLVTSCHIKAMGDKDSHTFTQRLVELAKQCDSGAAALPCISVDGPYGQPFDFGRKYTTILLVGGGIGITPLHAIFRTIVLLQTAVVNGSVVNGSRAQSLNIQRVKLLWGIRDTDLVEIKAFKDTFCRALSLMSSKMSSVQVEFAIHNSALKQPITIVSHDTETKEQQDNNEEVGEQVKQDICVYPGRFDLQKEIEALSQDEEALVFVCGAPAVEAQAKSLCIEHNVHIHFETFLL